MASVRSVTWMGRSAQKSAQSQQSGGQRERRNSFVRTVQDEASRSRQRRRAEQRRKSLARAYEDDQADEEGGGAGAAAETAPAPAEEGKQVEMADLGAAATKRRRRRPRMPGRSPTHQQSADDPLARLQTDDFKLVRDTMLRWRADIRHQNVVDAEIRRKDVILFALACLSVGLMILHETTRWDKIIDEQYQGNDSFSLYDVLIPVMDALLLWRLVDLYAFHAGLRCATGHFSSRWQAFTRTRLRWQFTAEAILCTIQSTPNALYTMPEFPGSSWTRFLGLLMFLRLYMAARVLRDYSLVYRTRRRTARILGLFEESVGSVLSLKSILATHPVWLIGLFLCFVILVFSYCIKVIERDAAYLGAETTINSWVDAIWFVCFTLTTIGYGDKRPTSTKGFVTAIAEVFVGMCFSSFLVAVLIDKISLDPQEAEIYHWTEARQLREKLRHSSAALIQGWWREHHSPLAFVETRYRITSRKRIKAVYEARELLELQAAEATTPMTRAVALLRKDLDRLQRRIEDLSAEVGESQLDILDAIEKATDARALVAAAEGREWVAPGGGVRGSRSGDDADKGKDKDKDRRRGSGRRGSGGKRRGS